MEMCKIEGIDYFDIFDPVIQWTTKRNLLISSVQLKLYTAQVDYTVTFSQAKLDDEVYLEMPRDFTDIRPSYYLQIIQAPHTY